MAVYIQREYSGWWTRGFLTDALELVWAIVNMDSPARAVGDLLPAPTVFIPMGHHGFVYAMPNLDLEVDAMPWQAGGAYVDELHARIQATYEQTMAVRLVASDFNPLLESWRTERATNIIPYEQFP